jgi:outer membrane protein assembly factor BamD
MIILRTFTLILACSLLLVLGGCKSNKDAYKGLSATQIYAAAEKNMQKENYGQAVKDFEALEARFPYGEFSDKAELGLINAYFKHNESLLAISTADRFIRMNPYHPNVDYAYYLKGLVAFEQNYTFSFRYLPLQRSLRDPVDAQTAFDTFKELVERFPTSQYVLDARKRMIFLRNQLADYELSVVHYYLKRDAYLSAANRANYILKNFEKTPAIPKALQALITAYRALGMGSLADDAEKTLKLNFPKHAV